MEKNYGKKDLEASLKRAFINGEADYIIYDGHTLRNKFLRETINYGISKAWLKECKSIDEDEILGKGKGQYSAYTYRLTNKGKKHFGIAD